MAYNLHLTLHKCLISSIITKLGSNITGLAPSLGIQTLPIVVSQACPSGISGIGAKTKLTLRNFNFRDKGNLDTMKSAS